MRPLLFLLASVVSATAAPAPDPDSFAATVVKIEAVRPELKRDKYYQGCRAHAFVAHDMAMARYPLGDHRPEMVALASLTDCLQAKQ